jgi:hypothetical protein
MSGKFKITLSNGDTYETADEQEFDAMMTDFTADGLKPTWSDADDAPSAAESGTYVDEMNVLGSNSEPLPRTAPKPAASKPAGNDYLRSALDTLKRGGQTATDGYRMLTHGLTLGYDDDIADGVASLANKLGANISGPTAAEMNKAALARSPIVGTLAQGAGNIATGVGAGLVAAPLAAVRAAPAAAGILESGVLGALQGAGEAETNKLAAAGDGTTFGLGAGALGASAGHLIGKGARAVRDWAGEAAAKGKNLVTGMGVRDAKATAAMHGVDAIDENYGGMLERYSPSGLTGKSPKSHHKVVLQQKNVVGDDLRELAKEINKGLVPDVASAGPLLPGTPGDLGRAQQKLTEELRREFGATRGVDAGAEQYRSGLQKMLDEITGSPDKYRTRARAVHAPEPEFPDATAQAAYDERRLLGLEPPTEAHWYDVSRTPGKEATPDRFAVSPRTRAGAPVQSFGSLASDDAAAAAERRALGLTPPEGRVPGYIVSRTPGSAGTPDSFSASSRSVKTAAPEFEDAAAREAFDQRRLLGLESPTDAYYYEVDRTPGRPGLAPFDSFQDLIKQKSELQQFAHSGPGNSVPESAQKNAAALAGRTLKDEVSRIVNQSDPELARRYVQQNEKFAELATLEEMLKMKTAAEGSGGDAAGIFGSAAVSGLAGSALAAQAGINPLLGGVGGFAGALGFGGGATRTAIRQALGARGSDAGANMLRGVERGAGNFASTTGAGRGSAAATALARLAQPQQPQPFTSTDRVMRALQQDPGSLGAYASRITFDPSTDPEGFSRQVEALEQSDPDFAQLVSKL